MPLNSICRTIAFSALCVSVAWARGGENPRQLSGESAVLLMQDAARLIASGSLGAAEASYNTILQGHPDNKEARLARGHVRAWQHKYEEARDDFLAVLRLDPNNLSALDGLGYSFAWAGAYDEGEKWFRRALGTAPGQIEATRGLAYVALWRGDVREAIRRFEGLLAQAPSDADAVAGLGQAYLAADRKREAREAFQRVQQLDPGRRGVPRPPQQTAEAGRLTSPVLELTAWGGHTWFNNQSGGDTGLRFAELAAWPARNLRVWFQLDNGLSLDNVALVQANRQVRTYYAGGLVNWRQHYTTRLDAGWRELPGKIEQKIVRAEQVVFFPRAYTFKVGGWAGPRSDGRIEWVTHTGIGVPLGKRFRLEPTFFYSRSGLPGEKQWRQLLSGEYAFKNRWRLGGGLAVGRAMTVSSNASCGLWDRFVNVSVPIGDPSQVQFIFRRETAGRSNGITVIGFGYTLYLPGRR